MLNRINKTVDKIGSGKEAEFTNIVNGMKLSLTLGIAPISFGLFFSALLMAQSPDWQLVYESGFEGSAGEFPGSSGLYQDWTTSHSATSTPPTLSLSGTGQLLMTNPSGGVNSQFANAYWMGGSSTISDGKITAVMQWHNNGNQSVGVMARVQNSNHADGGAFPQGYFVGILRDNPGTGNRNRLVIAKDISFAGVRDYVIEASGNIGVTAGNYYRLEFEFIGNELTASLYNPDNDTLITSITTTDNSYLSGVTGLRTNFGITNRTFGFESVRIESTIPEPLFAWLLIPLSVVLIRIRQQRSAVS